MKKGELYVFEGIDGAGKSSALDSVYKILKTQGINVVMVKNITKSPVGILLREIIIHKQSYLNDRYIANLFLAELHHVVEEIKGHIDNGVTVLCDRWFYSTIAYLDDKLFGDIAVMAKYDIKPTKTFFIDVPVDVANARLMARGDNSVGDVFSTIEKATKQSESYYKVMAYYSKHETADKHTFVVIDGTQCMSYVVMDILEEIIPSKTSKKITNHSHYGIGLLDNQDSILNRKKELLHQIHNLKEEEFADPLWLTSAFSLNPYSTYLTNKATGIPITPELHKELAIWCNKHSYDYEAIVNDKPSKSKPYVEFPAVWPDLYELT